VLIATLVLAGVLVYATFRVTVEVALVLSEAYTRRRR
jgi:hypothetical protein